MKAHHFIQHLFDNLEIQIDPALVFLGFFEFLGFSEWNGMVLRLGIAWISLDSLVRIESFQRVTGVERAKILSQATDWTEPVPSCCLSNRFESAAGSVRGRHEAQCSRVSGFHQAFGMYRNRFLHPVQ
jgi:hypothetical protein